MSPLITLLDRLHRISPPPPGRDEATGTERDLARRLGQLQAAALRVTPPPGAAAAAEADEAASTRGAPRGLAALGPAALEPVAQEPAALEPAALGPAAPEARAPARARRRHRPAAPRPGQAHGWASWTRSASAPGR
jgi:hypothetical protein